MLPHVHISYYLYIPIYNIPKPFIHAPQPYSLHVMEENYNKHDDSLNASQATITIDTKEAIMTPCISDTTLDLTFLEVVLNLHQPKVIFITKLFNKFLNICLRHLHVSFLALK
jgi:hypothetical protein